jgi:hypothetical protein
MNVRLNNMMIKKITNKETKKEKVIKNKMIKRKTHLKEEEEEAVAIVEAIIKKDIIINAHTIRTIKEENKKNIENVIMREPM